MDIIQHYVDQFNARDEEIYKNAIDNAHAADWMREEIPVFKCPDKEMERTYYFRWWTMRKHLKMTEHGWVFTEFLPKVPWSGMHNTINAAVGHHIYEARWLKNGQKYLSDYINFFLTKSDRSHQYSAWLIDAALQLSKISGCYDYGPDFLQNLCAYYGEWENTHALPGGMFWSLDGYDAMEFSISGTPDRKNSCRGARPTLNAYMYADAQALAEFARHAGNDALADTYQAKSDALREQINTSLWEDGFYRAFHYASGEDTASLFDTHKGESPRELIGYIPWMFAIPPGGREDVFDLLADENAFSSPYGLTTAERSHPRFLYEVNHECLWNGYVWPFATAQTLTALYTAIRHYPGAQKYRKLYTDLLHQYAASHTLTREDGTVVPWVDEVRHPLRDDWSSRTILRDWGWRENKGGYERGKDYNHSTFCDLVISGLVGIIGGGETPDVQPNIPDDWEYCRLSGLHYHGDIYDITYDISAGLQVTKR